MTLADRIVLLKEGVSSRSARRRKSIVGPANMFVAGFIGTPNMNFVEVDGRPLRQWWTLTGAGTVLSIEGRAFHLQQATAPCLASGRRT